MSASTMDTQTAARIVLAEYRKLERAGRRRTLEGVLKEAERHQITVTHHLNPEGGGGNHYWVSQDWTRKGLGAALAMPQLLDWLAKEAGEDL